MFQASHFGTVIENNSLKKFSDTMHTIINWINVVLILKKITNKYFDANLFNSYVDPLLVWGFVYDLYTY